MVIIEKTAERMKKEKNKQMFIEEIGRTITGAEALIHLLEELRSKVSEADDIGMVAKNKLQGIMRDIEFDTQGIPVIKKDLKL